MIIVTILIFNPKLFQIKKTNIDQGEGFSQWMKEKVQLKTKRIVIEFLVMNDHQV